LALSIGGIFTIRKDSSIKILGSFDIGTFSFGLLAIAGFSFWFFTVFPFSYHNESYKWVIFLHKFNLIEFLFAPLAPTWRPITQVITWIIYKFAGESIAAVQCFNYCVTALAWLLLYSAMNEKKLFALASFVCCSIFFSGFLYLFHIHAVVYPGVLLAFALIVWVDKHRLFDRMPVLLCTGGIVMGFWHPFALVLWIALISGSLLEHRLSMKKSMLLKYALFLVLMIGILMWLAVVSKHMSYALFSSISSTQIPVRDSAEIMLSDRIDAVIMSFKTLEVNKLASFVTAILAILTVVSIPSLGKYIRMALATLTAAIVLIFIFTGIPVMLLWISICIAKAFRSGNYALSAICLCAFLLPAGSSVAGSAYGLPALLVCIVIMVQGRISLEGRLHWLNRRFVVCILGVMLLLCIFLRLGLDIPVVSASAKPLFSEKEKTYHSERILEKLVAAGYCGSDVSYLEDASDARRTGNSFDRIHRPPMANMYLQMYWKFICCTDGNIDCRNRGRIIITFGNQVLKNAKLLFEEKGRFAGSTYAWFVHE
jgi:hypothetical protein